MSSLRPLSRVNAGTNSLRAIMSEEPKEKEPTPPVDGEENTQVPVETFFVIEAEALRVQNRLDEAIETCRRGLQTAPDFLPARLLLGRCYLEKEMQGEAKQELEKVAAIIEECLPVYKLLSKIYVHERKDVNKALEAVRRALYFTSQEVVRKKVTPLELDLVPPVSGPMTSSSAGITEAGVQKEWSDESSGKTTRSSIQTDTLAEIYVKQGKLEKALSIYDKILIEDPENGAALEKQEALRKTIRKKRETEAREKVIHKLESWLAKI